MPNGQTAPMSSGSEVGTGSGSAEVPPANTTASVVPIMCHACGQRGMAPLARIASGETCSCGSDDLDLDFTEATKEAAWETDMPMGLVGEVDVVTQPAKCGNCLQETMVAADDPASPMPPCPNCGADLLTAAGATLARRKTAAEPGEYGYEESDEYYSDREGNKECPECGSKADEDGYCTEPGCPNQGKTVAFRRRAALPGDGGLGGGGVWATLMAAVNSGRRERGQIPGWFKKYFSRLLLPEEIASGYFIESEAGGSLAGGFASKTEAAGPPKLKEDPLKKYKEEGERDYEQEQARKREQRQQRAVERDREADAEGERRSRETMGGPNKPKRRPDGKFSQKLEEITAGILATNPSMPRKTAERVARETLERYPKMLGSRD